MKNQYPERKNHIFSKEFILIVIFIASMGFSFWLINFDEMIKAFIGIAIINGWFFTILILNITGKIRFADDDISQADQDLRNDE